MRRGDCVRFSDLGLERLELRRDTVSGQARGEVRRVRGGRVTVAWSEDVVWTHDAEELERALPRAFGSVPPKEAA